METVNEVAFSTDGNEWRHYGLPKRGRIILYPDGIVNIEDSGGRTTTCRWDVMHVVLGEMEPLREMA
jgi:hypothetical protein